MKITHRKNGFTLVELLVVITIIVVLAGLTFSITRNIRTSADKVADIAPADKVLYALRDVTATIEEELIRNDRIQVEKELYIRADKNARYGVVARVAKGRGEPFRVRARPRGVAPLDCQKRRHVVTTSTTLRATRSWCWVGVYSAHTRFTATSRSKRMLSASNIHFGV